MLKKSFVLYGLLLSALVTGAYAQASAAFTGKVTAGTTQVVGGEFTIVLRLAEYPDHTFYIGLPDAPRFGLTNNQEIRTGAEFGQFMGNLEALKGRKVKLTGVKMAGSGAPDYRVKALERLNGK
jgi:hypothetical protein